MSGKRGRPRKDGTIRGVNLTDEEKLELKENVLLLLRGERLGEIEPLKSSSIL